MKLIVGLGNPGIQYQFTPHNLGFLTLDRIAGDHGVEIRNRQCHATTARVVIGQVPVVLAKPETFMNLSGLAVRELVESCEIDPKTDLIVIYDELDLPMGTIRIRERGSSAGHNGMKSIIAVLGSQEFLRIRIGIAPEKKILRPFPKSRLNQVADMIETAAEAVKVILTKGRAAAMNRFNRKPEASPEEGLGETE
ncbi:MAG: aminoacyl-tRNA hydrolase [Acidobacteria bacterium]|nr:aminoacyl-tRNA hydrolase [Acidobacteriota bacterium]